MLYTMLEVFQTVTHHEAMQGLVLAAGRYSKAADSNSSGPPAHTQQPASRAFGAKASKQAAVASMFKAAKPTPLACDIGESGKQDHGSEGQTSGSHGRDTEEMQHRKLAATTDALSHAEPDLSCGQVVSGSAAERNQSSAVELGRRHSDGTGSTETHNRADVDCSEDKLQHAAMDASGEQQGRSTDAASEGDALHSIDLAEQKQILHELWLEKNALSARGFTKRPATATKMDSKRAKLVSGNSRQAHIFSMLKKPP